MQSAIGLPIFGPPIYRIVVVVSLILAAATSVSSAADYDEVEQLFYRGEYAECAAAASAEVDRGIWNERWAILLTRCQLTTGQYAAAQQTFETALERYPRSLELRLLGFHVYRHVDLPEKSNEQLDEIVDLASASPFRFTSRTNLVTLGRTFLLRGEDARQILELFYDRVRREDPKFADAYIATAELALEKHDTVVAIDALRMAAKLAPQNPDISYLMARAWEESDGEQSAAALATTLQLNPKHVPALLIQAENQIDAEQYDDALQTLDRLNSVNSQHPIAWAYRAVVAHLQGNFEQEQQHRDTALSPWKTNPEIDYCIGRKLSQKYRFAEGAQYQRRALELVPQFMLAKFQLGQDLLRLGRPDEGWQLMHDVHQADGYHVVAFNLVNLHDRLQHFATLEQDGLIVRMTADEAKIYGHDVITLLARARESLCAKYQVALDGPVTVEIFPQQQDFAVRTFGMPGGDGFLGVCFGRVITANSPASQGDHPSNWQSVLWHEFCHVVTLEKTKNRMPRWLSEGISVYEERQQDTAWGEQLTPQYREMLLGDELTPVSKLSGAFLQPKSASHLQFAYYESSLVVEYLIEKHGLPTLLRLLDDLATGLSTTETFSRHVGPIDLVDREFTEYAHSIANGMAPKTDWERQELPERATTAEWQLWVATHPHNYWGLRRLAESLLADKDWEKSIETFTTLRELYPHDISPGNALEQLAQIYRTLGKNDEERQALEKLALLDNEAVPVYRRLMELAASSEDWPIVRQNAQRMLAVQPILPTGHEMLALAAEKTDDAATALAPLNALLAMNPVDPAQLHYRLAQAYEGLHDIPMARRHILLCLAEAPRYIEAQQLLLRLQSSSPTHDEPPPSSTQAIPSSPPAAPTEDTP